MTHKLDLSCPKCGSDHTQKITSVVSGGTSISTSHSSGVGFGAVGGTTAVFATGGTTHGHQQTVLAQQLAQPQPPVPIWRFWAAILVLSVIALVPAAILDGMGFNFLSMVALVAAPVWLWRWAMKRAAVLLDYSKNVYPNAIASWSKGYFCHRCESVFVPD
jgi:hypothetical protein